MSREDSMRSTMMLTGIGSAITQFLMQNEPTMGHFAEWMRENSAEYMAESPDDFSDDSILGDVKAANAAFSRVHDAVKDKLNSMRYPVMEVWLID